MSEEQNLGGNVVKFELKKSASAKQNATIALSKKEYSTLMGVLDASTDLCQSILNDEADHTQCVSDLVRALHSHYNPDEVGIGNA